MHVSLICRCVPVCLNIYPFYLRNTFYVKVYKIIKLESQNITTACTRWILHLQFEKSNLRIFLFFSEFIALTICHTNDPNSIAPDIFVDIRYTKLQQPGEHVPG